MKNKTYGTCGIGYSYLMKNLHTNTVNRLEQTKGTRQMTVDNIFKQGDNVIIHSLGDGKEYEGEVNGVTTNWPESAGPNIYIVKILSKDGMFASYKYSHFSVTGSCLKLKAD